MEGNGIYQIIVSRNGFASLDQRQPASTHHHQFGRSRSRNLECMFSDWIVDSLTDCYYARSQVFPCTLTIFIQLINKTKAQTVYKKPNEGREAKMKTSGSLPHTWQVRLYKGVQYKGVQPTYPPVYWYRITEGTPFSLLKVPFGNKC